MTLTRGARLLAQTVLTTVLAVAVGAALAAPASADAPAPKQSVAKAEIDFMEDTIMHHNLAIAMAELCLERATGDDQLPGLCAEVIEAQTAERAQLRSWLTEWYGVTPPEDTMLPPNGDQTLAKLAGYEGEEFDAAMAETFIRHHFGFLPDADKCRDSFFHDALRDLCDDMYDAQTAQIPQFRAVVAESSQKENYGPKGTPGGASTRGGAAPAGDHSTYRH